MSEVVGADKAQPGSLAAKIAERRKAIEEATSELFTVPGFEDLFMVELRPLSWKDGAKIAERFNRIPDQKMREAYIVSEQIVAATVGFHGIKPDGETEQDPNATWTSLYVAVEEANGTPVSNTNDLTDRIALNGLLRPNLRHILYLEWQQWANSGDVAKKVVGALDRD